MNESNKSFCLGILIGIYCAIKFVCFINKKVNEEIQREFNNSPLGQIIPRR